MHNAKQKKHEMNSGKAYSEASDVHLATYKKMKHLCKFFLEDEKWK